MSGYFVKASQQFQMPRSNSIKLRSDLLVFSTGLCLPSPILDRAHAADGEQTVTFFRTGVQSGMRMSQGIRLGLGKQSRILDS
jgi:hypothetical protein